MSKTKKKGLPIKRATKDTVFSDLFSIPKYKKELYLALHPKVRDVDENDIRTITLKHVITNGVVNDLSIIVSNVLMILVEAQSTWNENMPLRMLEYLTESISQYLNTTDQQLLSSKKVYLPNIELYVVYTGKKLVKTKKISLKKTFFANDKNCPIDVVVNVITLSRKNDVINEYIRFTKIFDKNIKIYGYTKQSINKTIKECVEKNILQEYLKIRKKEVDNIMSSRLWDQDAIIEEMKRVKEKEAEERGMKAGIKTGIKTGKLDLLVSLVNENLLTLEQACKKAKMTKKNFKALLSA